MPSMAVTFATAETAVMPEQAVVAPRPGRPVQRHGVLLVRNQDLLGVPAGGRMIPRTRLPETQRFSLPVAQTEHSPQPSHG